MGEGANKAAFRGRTVLVTGGASGMGRAIALAFAEEGAERVLVLDLQSEPREGGRPTVEEVERRTQASAEFVQCDLRSLHGLNAVTERFRRDGGIDVLVNNAGIVSRRPIEAETAESIDAMLAVNVRAPFLLSQTCAPAMAARGGGSIINVLSLAAFTSAPLFTAYSTTKAALHGLTIALATEFGPMGVRTNAVAPGRVRSAMTEQDLGTIDSETGASDVGGIPLGRYGRPVDIANACLFLASEEASYICGATLPVDGGSLISSSYGASHEDAVRKAKNGRVTSASAGSLRSGS